jgi:hypothetical protein
MRAVLTLALITIILFGWLSFNFVLHRYNTAKLSELERYPIIVFSSNTKLLQRLVDANSDSLYIAETKLEQRNELSQRLLSKYSLSNAEQYLDVNQLPDVLTITFKGNVASIDGRNEVLQTIGIAGSDVVARYNEQNWQIVVDDFRHVERFQRQVNLIIAILICCIVFVTRLLHEKAVTESLRRKKKLFAEAAGKRLNLFAETLIFTIIPVSINLVVYYYLVTEKAYPHILNGIQTAGICLIYLIANSMVVIFADRNYD